MNFTTWGCRILTGKISPDKNIRPVCQRRTVLQMFNQCEILPEDLPEIKKAVKIFMADQVNPKVRRVCQNILTR